MPASASSSGSPAAISAPNATNSRISVGRPLTQLGLVQRFRVDLVEVAPHRPLAGHLGACARRERRGRDVAAELARGDRAGRRRASTTWATGIERGAAVARDQPGLGGERQRVGDRRALGARRCSCATRRCRPAGSVGDRCRLVVDDDRVLGAERREVAGAARRAPAARSSPALPSRPPRARRSASARAARRRTRPAATR